MNKIKGYPSGIYRANVNKNIKYLLIFNVFKHSLKVYTNVKYTSIYNEIRL